MLHLWVTSGLGLEVGSGVTGGENKCSLNVFHIRQHCECEKPDDCVSLCTLSLCDSQLTMLLLLLQSLVTLVDLPHGCALRLSVSLTLDR